MTKNKKLRILVFIDWYLPGYKAGGGQRAFANLVSHLRDEFDFYILTRDCDFQESEPYEGIQRNEWTEMSSGEFVYYFPEKEVSFNRYRELFKEVNPDRIYINGIYSYKFSILPLILLRNTAFNDKIILGTYGMLAPTAIRIKGWKKRLFLYIAHIAGLYKNVVFHATSEQEEIDVKNVFGEKTKVMLAPHLPVKNFPNLIDKIKKEGELKMISLARISPEKNTLFALECLKEVKMAKVVLDLYGPLYDLEYWEKCLEVLNSLPSNVVITHKGIAEGNRVLDLLASYDCLFMPTRGENFGYSILESFMAGRPVIISNRTPWKGLEAKKAGFDLDLSNPECFTNAVESLAALNQDEFSVMCHASWNEAKAFVNNPELRELNSVLFL
ncbi:glycosyltransferase family 4 protein [Natronoflexus pectinivorans]|uniref:glycosyltransferase family 4 protein n=1 Tax=Natronoflexus pectinivorans TaxID=682526 RepID=UPI001046D7A1|nr:glycosyltransferase family 4 protein [Natronoflexus pectinivorans]